MIVVLGAEHDIGDLAEPDNDSSLLLDDELTKPTGLELPAKDSKVTERELKLAEQLIEEMSAKFEPEKYEDTYREALLEMIDKKIKGKGGKTKKVAAKKATTNVVDIMSKVKASLKESGVHRKTSAVAKSSKRRSTKSKAA